ncbi:hypothetical protein OENI_140005 [Oenococcus oeni]|nr:hypothetical protein OENI_140005 [Oenococcus oeni]
MDGIKKEQIRNSSVVAEYIRSSQINLSNLFKEMNLSPYIETVKNLDKDLYSQIGKFSNLAKQLEETNKIFQKQEKKRKPYYDKIFFEYKKTGWVMGSAFDYEIIINKKLDIDSLNEQLVGYYSNNHFQETFSELKEISDFLKINKSKGFQNQLDMITKVLSSDIELFPVIMPTLMAILSYIFDLSQGQINSNAHINYAQISKLLKKNKNKQDDYTYMFHLNKIAVLTCLFNLFSGSNFDAGPDKSLYTRHSVQHGRYNPDRFTKEDLIKLIVLISGICLHSGD